MMLGAKISLTDWGADFVFAIFPTWMPEARVEAYPCVHRRRY
jgi:hypothetical protein